MHIGKDLAKLQFEWTETCYKQALLEHYGHIFNKEWMKKLECRQLVEYLVDRVGRKYNTPEVHNTYIRYIKLLSTDKLNIIVEAYKQGKQHRAPDTIEQISTELFERAANTETKEPNE